MLLTMWNMLKLLYSASEMREVNPQDHSESIILKHHVWSSHPRTTSKLICNEESGLHLLCLGVSFLISDLLLTHDRFWFHFYGCSVCANMSQICMRFLCFSFSSSPPPLFCPILVCLFLFYLLIIIITLGDCILLREKGVALDGWEMGMI